MKVVFNGHGWCFKSVVFTDRPVFENLELVFYGHCGIYTGVVSDGGRGSGTKLDVPSLRCWYEE